MSCGIHDCTGNILEVGLQSAGRIWLVQAFLGRHVVQVFRGPGSSRVAERSETVRAARGGKFELESWQRGVHLATITANGNDVDPPLGVSGSYRQGRAATHQNRTRHSNNKYPKTPKAAVCQWLLPPKQAPGLTRKYGRSD
jgi:hypothetical protein